MAFAYHISGQQRMYFITATVHQWADVFTRPLYADILMDSFRFAQEQRGLRIYGWVLMPNHFHAIVSCDAPFELSNVLRDMKKFTSSQIVKAISDNRQESRRSWLLWLLRAEGGTGVKFWAEGNHPEEIWSRKFFLQKLNYIHNNPVRAGLVWRPEDWRYSSAVNYAIGQEGLLNLTEYDGPFSI